ncbi:hypothetical protein AB9P05_10090 [Roseivirga sp. BDSF3-8]|uniref:hypothetical protein n=1 Tax=Roseivirga sp. BDSF3-8 TaxID=3241598 RepID=UPI00353221D6
MRLFSFFGLVMVTLVFAGCSDDDGGPIPTDGITGEGIVYRLNPGEGSNASGTVSFYRLTNGLVRVTIGLENTVPGGEHPAHLHYGSASLDNTLMAAMLNPVDGDTGISTTDVDVLADDSDFTFDDLLAFDGHVKVHLDAGAGYTTILAVGDIGANAVPVN